MHFKKGKKTKLYWNQDFLREDQNWKYGVHFKISNENNSEVYVEVIEVPKSEQFQFLNTIMHKDVEIGVDVA